MAKVYIPPQAQIAAILTEDGQVKYIYMCIYTCISMKNGKSPDKEVETLSQKGQA